MDEEEEEEEEVSSSVEYGEDMSEDETELVTAATEEGKLDSSSSKGKCPAADDSEDLFKNLWEKTVTGKRGRPGTKPHETDTPETHLAKKKALLSGDPRELKKVMENQDPTGYFRRAFGNFLNSPAGSSHKTAHFNAEEKSATAALSSLRYDRSQNFIDNFGTCIKKSSLAVDGSKTSTTTTPHQHGSMEGSSTNINNNGNKMKTMDSEDSYMEHGTSQDADDEDSSSPDSSSSP